MKFFLNEQFHIYNRGNNRQRIFFSRANYEFFLAKVKKYICPHCDILSYCLMPNHFHLHIRANKGSLSFRLVNGRRKNVLSEGFRIALSSYAQAINLQNSTVGSLFQQNTRCKSLLTSSDTYGLTCFHYIHQNPVSANLVRRLEDWQYSSFRDYHYLRKDSICNTELGIKLLRLNMATFYEDSYRVIGQNNTTRLFTSKQHAV
jgi:REP element-mobilizing transposase RayT